MIKLMHHGRAAALVVSMTALGISATVARTAAASATDFSFTTPDGSLTVTGPTTLLAGSAGVYTATLTNVTAAPTDGQVGVFFDVTTPPGMSLQRISGCSSIGGSRAQVNFECIDPNLAPGASATATFTEVGVTPGPNDLAISAFAAAVNDSGEIGGTARQTVTVQPGPTDVQVTGSSNNGGPAVGTPFTYTFQIKDNGPQAASGVTLDDQLPAGLTLAGAAAASIGSCSTDAIAGALHCSIGNLAGGQQSNITLPVTAAVTGTIADTATVAISGTDSQPANNSVTVTVQPRSN